MLDCMQPQFPKNLPENHSTGQKRSPEESQNQGLENMTVNILAIWESRYEIFIEDARVEGLYDLATYFGYIYIRPSKESSRILALKFYQRELHDPQLRQLKMDFEEAVYAIAKGQGQTLVAFLNHDFDQPPTSVEITSEMNRLNMLESKKDDFTRLVKLYLKYKAFSFSEILDATRPQP
jgi:hypothetical protein